MVDSLDDEFVKSFLGEEDTNTENTAITNKMTTDSDADFFTDAFLNSDEDNTDISVETITASENVNETVQTQEQLKKQAMLQYPKLFDESGSIK